MKKRLLLIILPILILVLVVGTIAAWIFRPQWFDWLDFSKNKDNGDESSLPYEKIKASTYWIDLAAFAADPANGFTPLDWQILLKDSAYDFVILPPELFNQVNGPVIVDLTTVEAANFAPEQVPGNITPLGVKVKAAQVQSVKSRIPKSWVIVIDDFSQLSPEQIPQVEQDRLVGLLNSENLPDANAAPLTLRVLPVSCPSRLRDCLRNPQWANQVLGSAQKAFEGKYLYRFYLTCPNCTLEERFNFTQIPRLESFSVMNDGFPSPEWRVRYPNTLWIQGAYSMQYDQVTASGSEAFWKTGIVGATNTADWFIPVKQPSSQSFTAKIQLWLDYSGNRMITPQKSEASFTYAFIKPELPATVDLKKIQQAAWIPEWGHPLGIESLKENPAFWDELNPVWYLPQKDGTLKTVPVTNNGEIIAIAKQHNIRIVPSLPLFDADVLTAILTKSLDKHVDEIVKVVVQNQYAGIELDYESTYIEDKAKLEEFVTKLANELHTRNKTIAFTALPKWSDRDIYSFLPQTHVAQDWEKLGAVVDEFRPMAYDFTAQGSTRPGPLSPLLWNDLLLKYAVSKMPKEKVILALPLYSHSWAATPESWQANGPKDPTGPNNDQSIYEVEKQTYSFVAKQIRDLSGLASFQPKIDDWNREIMATYKDNGTDRTMFYLNKDMLQDRYKLAAKYGIKGVAYWRLGGNIL